MKILIIEDEALAARRIKAMVTGFDSSYEVLDVLNSVATSVKWLQENPAPDLILMDIELVDGQSFEIFNEVEVKCPVIFTTAYDEYAIKAFKVNSIDYLLKPVNEEELKSSIEKFYRVRKAYSQHSSEAINIQNLLQELKSASGNAYRDRFLIKNGDRFFPVEVNEVAYFFTKEKANFIMTHDNRSFLVDYTLDDLEKAVDPKKFFRANRQFLIDHKSVAKVHLWFNSKLKVELKPKAGEEVVVSREKAAEFRQWLGE